MRRAIGAALAVLVLSLGAYLIMTQLSASAPPTNTAHNDPAVINLARPADSIRSQVAYVHDGDTLFLQPEGTTSRDDQVKVRIIGVDTPELGTNVECFAIEARDYLRMLLPVGTEVWISQGQEPLDHYGRSLYYLWTDSGDFVNLDLVENGYATALRVKPNEAYWPELRDAEAVARAGGLGLWGSC